MIAIDMEMPPNCLKCPFEFVICLGIRYADKSLVIGRPEDCPLREVREARGQVLLIPGMEVEHAKTHIAGSICKLLISSEAIRFEHEDIDPDFVEGCGEIERVTGSLMVVMPHE